ncbi:helix-turn-helix transcriptional regulator [Endobacterium cereale]|jgi:LuxR family quorum sensing-dependent transcriptional regulator|nr:LuxR C-terminal-related transcriptional regulator [Endobacterium cereale]MEB2846899.1 LuxR C-terminal-related transcriptional regulator [Endobacterium cereale]
MRQIDMENLGASAAEGVDITEIPALKTQFDVFRFMKRLAETYRQRAFMVMNLPAATATELAGNTIITNWPAELLTAFDQAKMLTNSTLVRKLRRTSVPFAYDLEQVVKASGNAVAKNMFERFNLVRGGYFPVSDIAGHRGVVSIIGDGPAFSRQQMMELMYVSIHVFERLSDIRSLDVRVTEQLSDRELDCLNWTAAGKTSSEIAGILGLSEHTVNHYLNRATKKLDTVNRTQAVAKALRVGLIK